MSDLTVAILKTTMSKSKDAYFVGIITALPIERAAVIAMLDEEHAPPFDFEPHPIDTNSYKWGTISQHNVVLASLSAGNYGTTGAATTVLPMKYAFPGIKWGLMVGIAGGIPSDERDIRLGDVVVSQPKDGSPGIFQYDFGKVKDDDDWQSVGWLARPPEILLKALSSLQSEHEFRDGPYQTQQNLQDAIQRHPAWGMRFGFPHGQIDRLFLASQIHKKSSKDCTACDTSMVVERSERQFSGFHVHYGVVASGNSLVRDARFRDRIAERMNNCICLEMEAAGVVNDLPCLVIRGICDYADSHKSDTWQRYASATAAAFAKELLSFISTIDSRNEKHHVRADIQAAGNGFDKIKIADAKDTISNEVATSDVSAVELEIPATTHELDNRAAVYEPDSTEITKQADDATSTIWTKIPGAYDDTSDAEFEVQAATDQFDKLKIANHEEDAATRETLEVDSLQDQQFELPMTLSNINPEENDEKTEETHKSDPANAAEETDVRSTSDTELIEDQQYRSWMSFTTDDIESREREEEVHQIDPATTTDEAATRNEGTRSVQEQETEPPCMSPITRNTKDHENENKTRNIEPVSLLPTGTLNFATNVHEALVSGIEDDSALVVSHKDFIETQQDKALQNNEVSPSTPEVQQETESISTEYPEVVSNQSTHVSITTVQDTSGTAQLEEVLNQSLVLNPIVTPDQEGSKSHDHEAHNSGSTSAVPTVEVSGLVLENPRPVKDKEAVDDISNRKLDSNDTTVLHIAAADGDYHGVEILLDRGADIHAKNIRGAMPLHFAAINGKVEVVRLLLDRKANIEARGASESGTALHLAASTDQVEVVRLLLDRKANIEARGGADNCTALHFAVIADNVEVVRLLLERKANLEATGARKWTALHFAAYHGHVGMTRFLLGQGANLEARGSDHCTALHYAAAGNHVKVVRLLLRRSAKLETTSARGWTVLHHAASEGYAEMVETLLEHGAYTEAKDPKGMTALHIAASEGHVEIVDLLLEQRADIEAKDIEGRTALHIAACKNHMDVIRLLLGRKARLNVGDDKGKTALHHAVSEGHADIVSLLLYRKARLESVAIGGRTALHYAVCKDSVDLVQLLLDHKANLEAVATGNWRALHFAAAKGYVEMVELLLASGADPRVKTEQHYRPSDLAKRQGHEEIVQLLKNYGAGPRPGLLRAFS